MASCHTFDFPFNWEDFARLYGCRRLATRARYGGNATPLSLSEKYVCQSNLTVKLEFGERANEFADLEKFHDHLNLKI